MTLAGTGLLVGRSRGEMLGAIAQIWRALSLCQLCDKLAFKMFCLIVAPYQVSFKAWVGRWIFPNLRSTGSDARPYRRRLKTNPENSDRIGLVDLGGRSMLTCSASMPHEIV